MGRFVCDKASECLEERESTDRQNNKHKGKKKKRPPPLLAKWGTRKKEKQERRENKHVTGAVSTPAQQVISNKSATASRNRGIE